MGQRCSSSGVRRNSLGGRLAVELYCYPPDNRRRDLDNLPKGLLDSLWYCQVIHDDGDIDSLLIQRVSVVTHGRIGVKLRELTSGREES